MISASSLELRGAVGSTIITAAGKAGGKAPVSLHKASRPPRDAPMTMMFRVVISY
jgi:hypothetical protein